MCERCLVVDPFVRPVSSSLFTFESVQAARVLDVCARVWYSAPFCPTPLPCRLRSLASPRQSCRPSHVLSWICTINTAGQSSTTGATCSKKRTVSGHGAFCANVGQIRLTCRASTGPGRHGARRTSLKIMLLRHLLRPAAASVECESCGVTRHTSVGQ